MNATLEDVNGEAHQREATVGSYTYSIGIFFGVLTILIAYSYYYIIDRLKPTDTTSSRNTPPIPNHRRRRYILNSSDTSDYDSESEITSHGLDESTSSRNTPPIPNHRRRRYIMNSPPTSDDDSESEITSHGLDESTSSRNTPPIPNHWRRRYIMNSPPTSDDDSESEITSHGLDESTINSFPMLLYSDVKSNKGGHCGDSGCCICLQDYIQTDSIRLLPECGHFYHVKCVDVWLRINPSCPICRNSLIRTPVDNPPAAEVEVAAMSMQ